VGNGVVRVWCGVGNGVVRVWCGVGNGVVVGGLRTLVLPISVRREHGVGVMWCG